ncbi:MAG TPA: YtxH domain-containing protein [Candidatus Saccharimonadales bacterium]|nr:YtxH domain-containing protein [Candidatus Saccharimonadales bacterium]
MGKKSNLKNVAIGSAIAAAAGFVAGILTAPKSGKETRKDIKNAAETGYREAEKQLKQLHTQLDKVVAEAKLKADKASGKAQKELNALVDKAKDTKEKAREMLSAIHEGDAEDKDLKKAVKDATDALEHLRDYLKK